MNCEEKRMMHGVEKIAEGSGIQLNRMEYPHPAS